MPRVAHAIDDMFHGTPVPTKSESEQAFKLDFINTLGSVKVFILSICGAVVFTTLLVCANTMAMSIRERTREVAVLRTLGFTRENILKLLLSESIAISLMGGLVGVLLWNAGRQGDVPSRHRFAGFDAHDHSHRTCRHAGCSRRRVDQRPHSFLPRLEPRHRRRPALYRLNH